MPIYRGIFKSSFPVLLLHLKQGLVFTVRTHFFNLTITKSVSARRCNIKSIYTVPKYLIYGVLCVYLIPV